MFAGVRHGSGIGFSELRVHARAFVLVWLAVWSATAFSALDGWYTPPGVPGEDTSGNACFSSKTEACLGTEFYPSPDRCWDGSTAYYSWTPCDLACGPGEERNAATGLCEVAVDCTTTANVMLSASTSNSLISDICVDGCGYSGVAAAGDWLLVKGTGENCSESNPTEEPVTETADGDGCYTSPAGTVTCPDVSSGECAVINGQTVCTGPSGCGYVNGQFICPEFSTNCGYFNGERVCIESAPDLGGSPLGCIADGTGRVTCMGDTGEVTVTTSTSDDGTTTTTTTTTTNNFGGQTSTTVTETDNATGDTTETTEIEGQDENLPDGDYGESEAGEALGESGLEGWLTGVEAGSLDEFAGLTLPTFDWVVPGAGGSCSGFAIEFRGSSWVWDDYCAYWDSEIRPLLGWFFYMLTVIEVFRVWRAATGVE